MNLPAMPEDRIRINGINGAVRKKPAIDREIRSKLSRLVFKVSFLNPTPLRERCQRVIEDEDKRNQAIELSEELQLLSQRYHEAVLATVEAYQRDSIDPETSAAMLIEILQPLDDARARTLAAIIQLRQSFRKLLTAEEWQRLFE